MYQDTKIAKVEINIKQLAVTDNPSSAPTDQFRSGCGKPGIAFKELHSSIRKSNPTQKAATVTKLSKVNQAYLSEPFLLLVRKLE
jgi:hypothetical protein